MPGLLASYMLGAGIRGRNKSLYSWCATPLLSLGVGTATYGTPGSGFRVPFGVVTPSGVRLSNPRVRIATCPPV